MQNLTQKYQLLNGFRSFYSVSMSYCIILFGQSPKSLNLIINYQNKLIKDPTILIDMNAIGYKLSLCKVSVYKVMNN